MKGTVAPPSSRSTAACTWAARTFSSPAIWETMRSTNTKGARWIRRPGKTVKLAILPAVRRRSAAQRFFQLLADLRLVGEGTGRIVPRQQGLGPFEHRLQGLRMAEQPEAALAHAIEHELGHVGRGHA